MTEVRLATARDAKEIREIYSPSILNAAISFETEAPSVEEMQSRIETILQKYPWIVCITDGKIAGYAYASKHRVGRNSWWTA